MGNTALNIPNIFKYATSELTQDAFLAWLLQWADRKFEIINKSLYSCACDMLELFIGEKIDVNSVDVFKQWEKIDLWFTFNGDTILIIEDKTSTTFHDKQLERYKEISKDWCNDNLDSFKIKYIYYKSEDYNNFELEYVKNCGYKAITRQDILTVLEKYYDSANSDFMRDYYLYLLNISNVENEVFEKSFDEIKNCEKTLITHMKGFSNYFASKIGGDWNYVDNPSETFIEMKWNWIPCDYCEFYFQFHNFDLKIKICELQTQKNLTVNDIRNKAWHKIENVIKKHGYKISKTNRMRNGKSITIACIDESLWLAKDSYGKIDKDETLKKLKFLDKILNEIVSE